MILPKILMIQVGWIFPLLIWLVLLCFFCAIFFAMEDGFIYLQRLHQIPCNRCLFHTGETCLKCTVHPYKAFTEEAITCEDWEANYIRHS